VNSAAQDEAPGEGLVADYLANRLNEAEAQAFELYCLEHPDFAREVEGELALKTGLREAHKSVAKVSALTPRRRVGRWPLAFAATVAVLASAFLIVQHLMERPTPLVAFASTADVPDSLRRSVVSHVSLLRVRGIDPSTQVSVAANSVVEIRLLPDLDSKSGDYTIQISAESASSIKPLTVRNLRPEVDGFLQFYLPASQMLGRTWSISVSVDGNFGGSQPIEVFRVEFVTALGPAQ
jgi:hypothetical protein